MRPSWQDNGGKKKNQSSRMVFSSSMIPQSPRRTIEEVWEDITHERFITPPVSMEHHHIPASAENITLPATPTTLGLNSWMEVKYMGIQPVNSHSNTTSNSDSSHAHYHADGNYGNQSDSFISLPSLSLSLSQHHIPHQVHRPNPTTSLSFWGNTHCNTTSNSDSSHAHYQADGNGSNQNDPFISHTLTDAIISSPPTNGLCTFLPKKRPNDDSVDRKHKRMMKNRESASRSRARKQAHTKQLQLEVAQLVAENAKLRKQCEKLQLALAAQLRAKNALQRTSTAPF